MTIADKEIHASSAVPAVTEPDTVARTSHSHAKLILHHDLRRMVIRLPYSNSDVVTGTDATIQVLMSQSELSSLGFPVNASLHDRRVVTELTLGDDGLPRAVSLPLPLEVVKEKK
ncbi:MAG TPA: hypothetical protein VHT24_01345 [Pseudacidobacterium sp.]|nr:hypothetical protein [Pseudacidobacterium sp.]